MATIYLNSPDDTLRFGQSLAERIRYSSVRTLLLRGDLGSGKTALTRALTEALPGGSDAEVSSPSFTVCNHYPTVPPVLHCDLYRCQEAIPDEILDALEQSDILCIIEWSEFLPAADRPQDFLDILLETCDRGRLLTLEGYGPKARQLAMELYDVWHCEY